ncbi:MAG: hypothetical protein C0606_04480 [Hyphomicrobiales bacterium]|nr:MAG: hypothetical protein C0606_04480 [Hyphomicrobiales bacterium]
MALGGKTVFGATVGILMLETRFPRIPGDMGNALTWPFPVHYRVVRGASPDVVVRRDPSALKDAFIEAGRDLVAMGADGITTNCGFLIRFQNDLADALGVPVATSALMQVPLVEATLPADRRVGVLSISANTLTPALRAAAGISEDTPVVGTDGGREFTRAILDDEPEMNVELARQDLLDAAAALIEDRADIGAIVLECTNMVPYAADIRRLTGLPVYSIYSFVSWFQAGLLPRRFPEHHDDPRY